MQIRSGSRPQRSTANSVPLRPMPVFTSSAQNSQPCSSQSAVIAVQNESGGAMQPPEPSTGSITIPAIRPGSTTWKSSSSRM